MKKIMSVLLVVLLLVTSIPMDAFAEQVEINVYNWGEYVPDGSDGFIDVNAEFTKRTGIKVNETNYQSNEEMFTKLSGGGVSYDLVVPSDYMISKMIERDMLAEINYDNIPNYKNVSDDFKNLEYDPQNRYSVPFTGGTVGIIYNKKMIKPGTNLNSWSVLWDENYKNSYEEYVFSIPEAEIKEYEVWGEFWTCNSEPINGNWQVTIPLDKAD